MIEQQKRLGDDRREIGDDFERAQAPEDHRLGRSFVEHQRADVETVGDQFAHPDTIDRHRLGESFADPNSLDDQKLGESFEETNSRRRKKRREPKRPNQPGGHRLLYWILAGVFVAFLLIFLLGYLPRHSRNKENARNAKEERDDVPVVEAQKVERAKDAAGLVVPGTTTPLTEAFVYARANGYLKKRYVDIGDRVRKGQLLALIDSPDLDQQVDQAREQLRQAEAQRSQQDTQLALARITVERWRVLVQKGVFSRQEGDQREADYQAQLANVAAAERNVEAFRANLGRVIALQSYERVTSPFDGVITSRNVDVGALISAQGSAGGMGASSPSSQSGGTSSAGSSNSSGSNGSAPTAGSETSSTGGSGGALFSIAQVDRLRILVSVPEGYASAIRTGQRATVHFQELPRDEIHGEVTRSAASIDQNTRTLLTEVQVDNHDRRLLTGMYAVVTFQAVGGPGPLTVPGDAIAVRQDRNVVALIRDGKVHLQPVEIGRDYGPAVEVTGGLEAGETIAASFTDDVKEGAKVKPQESKVAGEAAAPKAAPNQNAPPGGSTQYGNQSVTDQNMQGQAGKQSGGGQKQGASGRAEIKRERQMTRSGPHRPAARKLASVLLLLVFPQLPAQQAGPAPANSQATPPSVPDAPPISHFIESPSSSAEAPGMLGMKTPERLRPAGLTLKMLGLIGPYHAPTVPQLFSGSGTRLNSLVHDDKLFLTLHDAIALALENNLDVEVERYNLELSDTDLLRAKGGGSLRGIDYTLQEPPNGVGGPGSPLLNSTATNVNPTTPAVTDLTALNSTAQVQTNLSTNGQGLTYAPGPTIPLFDPSLIGTAGYFRRSNTVSLVSTGSGTTGSDPGTTGSGVTTQTPPLTFVAANLAYLQGFSTGAQLEATVNNDSQVIYSTKSESNPFYSPSTSVTLTQPLLRGRGRSVNLRFIRVANINRRVSRLLFEQQVLDTIYGTSRIYFDLVSLGENIVVKQEALRAAQKLRQDDADQVVQGTLAPIELTRASALVSSSEFDLTQAQGLYRQQEVILRNLLIRSSSPVFSASFSEIVPSDRIVVPDSPEPLSLEALVQQGLSHRPDLAQARLQIQANQANVQGSRNQVLPQLNVYGNVETRGSSEVSYEPLGSPGTGAPTIPQNLALGGLRTSTIYQGGVQLTLPIRNRIAAADAARDTVQLRQSQARTEKLDNQAREEIETALIALETALAAYKTSVTSRVYQEQLLEAERDKLAAGQSTNLLVVQNQTYVAQARSTEIAARSNWVKARIELDRATGDLLEKNNIQLDDAVSGTIPQR